MSSPQGVGQPPAQPSATVPGQKIVQPGATTAGQGIPQPTAAPTRSGSPSAAPGTQAAPTTAGAIASPAPAAATSVATAERVSSQPTTSAPPPVPTVTAQSVSQAGASSPTDGLPVRTPYFRDFWGTVTVDGSPAPIGTKVQALSPRGDLVGLYSVDKQVGSYGYMRIYGEDPTSNPPIPGMKSGETVVFKVNEITATTSSPATWQPAFEPVRLELTAKK